MYVQANTVEAARANCAEARRRLVTAPHGSQRQRDAMSDLARFEAQAATLAARRLVVDAMYARDAAADRRAFDLGERL